jgi:7,8-dihydropterin-6-yl-methyl-4-(beta-D-ribofuranosyl)aminobenzene 5'-phosphate synthase
LICHPGCFIKRYRKKDDSYIGLGSSLNEIKERYNLILSSEPYPVSTDVIFLGEVPRGNSFEAQKTPFYKDGKKDDFVCDDSGLAIITDLGLIVVSGCAHSGICNTVEYAKEVTGIKNVHAVIGGFHLKKVNDTMLKTIEYFKKNRIDNVYPCHCVDDCVMNVFSIQFPNKLISAGTKLSL